MSDENDREEIDEPDENTANEGDDVEEQPQPGPPEMPDLGIDPQEMMRDPFGAMFKLMSDPNAMQAFQGFLSSPAAQQMLSQGMDNPMLKQIVEQNPMLKSMISQAEAKGFDLNQGLDPSTLFGGAPAQPAPADEDEEEEELLDEPVVALLDPPLPGAKPWAEPSPVGSIAEVTSDLNEDAQRAVIELAGKRARHHLGDEGMSRLGALASQHGKANAIDLLACQGAFMGELAWYAICTLEEEYGAQAFIPLARHALQCVTFNSGYRVPSFVNQLVQYLLDVDSLREEDLRHAIWSLSGQPRDGVDGVFEIDWECFDDNLADLAETELDNRLIATWITAMLGWKELDLADRSQALDHLLDEQLEPPLKGAFLDLLAELIEDGHEEEGLRINHLPRALLRKLGTRLPHEIGVQATLEHALKAHFGGPWDFHIGLLETLDVLWNEADEETRQQYLDKLISTDHERIRRLAYRVAAAWAPHDYLARASEDPSDEIRAWADDELKVLG